MTSGLDELHKNINECRVCENYGIRIIKPGSMDRGTATARIMVIGLAPSAEAIKREIAFFGNSFTRMHSWLNSCGYHGSQDDLRKKLYLTSINKCAVDGDTEAYRSKLWKNCRPFLWKQILAIEPSAILVLGKEPAEKLLGKIENWDSFVGTRLTTSDVFENDLIRELTTNAHWLILPHPSGLSRTMNDTRTKSRVLESLKNLLHEIDFS